MRKSRLLQGALATSWVLAACTGFDPSKLFPPRAAPDDAGAAGWSYDADAAGRGGSSGHGGDGGHGNGSSHLGGSGGRLSPAGGSSDGGSLAASGGFSGGEESMPAGEGGASGAVDGEGDALGGRVGGGGRAEGGSSGAHGGSAHAGGSSSSSGGNGAHGGTGGAQAGRGGTAALGGASGQGGAASSGSGGSGTAGAGAPNGVGGANGGGAGAGNDAQRGLYFGEYVEGSGKYKALELEGVAGTPLGGCEIATYSNGASTPGTLALDGVLGAAGTYVLCSSSLADVAGVRCDRSTNLSFNGNDAVALVCGGVTLDVIGEIGFDPGVGWTDGDVSTANSTLRRRCGAHGDPNGTDAFDPALEWIALAVDTVDGLGDSACE